MYAMKKENNELFNFTDNIEVFEDDIRKLFLKIDDIEIKDNEVYIYVDNNVKVFKKPANAIKPKFNYSTLKWEEEASQGEIEENLFKESVEFYNVELEFASKANVELVCGIITEDIFEEVKIYIKAIDPYAGIKTISEVKRPEIFKKYL